MSGKFRVTVWDPTLIISQILAVQCAFYFTFGILIAIGCIFSGAPPVISSLFSYKAMNFTDRQGILTAVAFLLNPIFGSFALWRIVKRTKLCLDFTVTTYFLHMLVCWAYNGFLPNTILWWVLTAAGITMMCVMGEFLCLKTELEDIPLLGARVEL